MGLDPEGFPKTVAATIRSILVVDDEAVIRDLCARVFQGYRVLQAESGSAALALLEREKVDVVLADVMMPNMNGLDLLRTIKERSPNQVVIVMTGYADKDVILRALKASADDFVTKPINLLQLRSAVDHALEKQALREELLQFKRIDRLKSEFLGLISHKLKTPATAISLFIQNLASGIGDPDDPGFRETLALVLDESRHLEYLIKDLLYYSEFILQDEVLHPELLELRDVADTVLAELARDFVNKQIDLRLELPAQLPPLTVDRKRISFVLRALLENAIKFTPAQGRIALQGEILAGSVRLTVSDSGPGIAREELPKIFEKFYQIDPKHTGQVRGFGLGLYYARQFVLAHGGSIQIDSRPGEGTMATVELPLP